MRLSNKKLMMEIKFTKIMMIVSHARDMFD